MTSICGDVRTYEEGGRGEGGYNGTEGHCKRGCTVIEDNIGTGVGRTFSRWISGRVISEMRKFIQRTWLVAMCPKIPPF